MSSSSSSNDDIGGDRQETTDNIGAINERTSEFICLSHKVYVNSGNQRKVFYLLCLGLSVSDTNNDPLFSLDSEPWCMLPKTGMRPDNLDFAKDIFIPTPRPLNWPKSQKIEWLVQTHPVQDNIDISSRRGEVMRLKEILEQSLGEERQ